VIHTRPALLPVLLLVPLWACASHGEKHGDRAAARQQPETVVEQHGDFHWKGDVDAGKSVEVRNINGAIHVEAASGEVRVEATKSSEHGDDVRVQAVEHDGGVTICVLYPGMKMDQDGSCRSSGGGGHHSDVSVDFQVFLPEGVRFIGHTVNGNIRTAPLKSEVEAYTVNGSINVDASHAARARTVNGSIKASIAEPEGSDSLEFETVNGSITLTLPEKIDADLNASTVNGQIRTDFPLAVRTGLGPGSSLQGRLGDGGRSITLTTVSGSIRLAATGRG
jgi:hypothetical protein